MFKSRIWYIACAVCCVVVVCFVTDTKKKKPSKGITVARREPVKLRQRRAYPYSVISGGVESGEELRTALLTDSVAAEHYAGFQVERTQVKSLDRPHRYYVSYRKGDRVYWTQNRLTLPKGETILTDGSLSARTRCGNRLSDTPQSPTLVKEEPSQKEFEEFVEPDSYLLGWNGEHWQDTETSSTVAKDYQSSFGPDLGTLARTNSSVGGFGGGGGAGGGGGSGLGGGGGGGGGGGPIQSGPSVPPSGTTGSTSGGSNTGNMNPIPISGNPGSPGILPVPSVPSVPPAPISYQPVVGTPTGGAAPPSLPATPLWTPIIYSFPYPLPVSRPFLANTSPPISVDQNVDQIVTSSAGAPSTSNQAASEILPVERLPSVYVTNDNVPMTESPEPHTLALIMAAGILACASGSVRQRLRKPAN